MTPSRTRVNAIQGSVDIYADLPADGRAGDCFVVKADGKAYEHTGTGWPPEGAGVPWSRPAPGCGGPGTGGGGTSGKDGTSIRILGSVPTYADLPADAAVAGDCYVVEFDGKLYDYDGAGFPLDGFGVPWVGKQGEQGQQGIQGPAGLGINYRGTVATAAELPAAATHGDLWVVDDPVDPTPAHGWVWDAALSDWIDAGPIQGPQGVPGTDGKDGTDGIDGAPGNPGAPGPTAVSADAGNQSRLGSDGLIYVPAPPPNATYTLPAATDTVLGGVKVGAGVVVAADGTLSVPTPFLPLAGGTMTGTIVAPTAANAITFGASGYGIIGGSGGVALRNGNTNLMVVTAANAAYSVPLQTVNNAAALQFGSGGPTMGRGANGIVASTNVEAPTAPTMAGHLTPKSYVDARVVVTAAGASAPATTGLDDGALWVEV